MVPGRVFGLATSQIATDVLTGEGLAARNVARWLTTQDRLAAGPGSGEPQPVEGDEQWRLRAGDLVVVDESGMTDTAALAAIHGHVDAAGAKLLLVGDHRQLAAVGAGDGMDLLAGAGNRCELAEARRFSNEWERAATLRLRAGDAEGRDANTARVATVSTVDDPAQGAERRQVHRDPVAVLAGVLDEQDSTVTRSALAIATEAAEEAGNVRSLSHAAVRDQPQWALDALGPVPEDLTERVTWRERAGVVAAYRELRGHDDPTEALGSAPKAGQVEQYAAYRAAWRALGRPEIDQALHEKSDGQLRMRVRGWQRQQTWAPRYVGHELAGTRQAADHHRQTAALRRAEAEAAATDEDRDRLQREATEAAALAETLDQRDAAIV